MLIIRNQLQIVTTKSIEKTNWWRKHNEKRCKQHMQTNEEKYPEYEK